MSETAGRSQDIIVRSRARRVRTQAIWLSAVTRTSNRPAFWVCFSASVPLMAGSRSGSRRGSYPGRSVAHGVQPAGIGGNSLASPNAGRPGSTPCRHEREAQSGDHHAAVPKSVANSTGFLLVQEFRAVRGVVNACASLTPRSPPRYAEMEAMAVGQDEL